MANSTNTSGIGRYADPAVLMRIRALDLRVRLIMDGFYNGLHRSPLHGFSVEFSEYRQYTEGDDPRFIDWKIAARSDRYFIKLFEDETNLRCHLVFDNSRSMAVLLPRPAAWLQSMHHMLAESAALYCRAACRPGDPAFC